jgi:hypothetical protein
VSQYVEPDLLTQARVALAGHRADEAQGILVNLVVAQPRNEEAWLLLASTFDNLERRMECLQRARELNPYSPLIVTAIQELKAELASAAFGQAKPAPNASTEPLPPAINPALAKTLLDAADLLTHAALMTTEPLALRDVGLELVHLLERAQQYDSVVTRRWVASAGRAALVKYEKALTQLLINLPQDDAKVASLRAERQHALDLFK